MLGQGASRLHLGQPLTHRLPHKSPKCHDHTQPGLFAPPGGRPQHNLDIARLKGTSLKDLPNGNIFCMGSGDGKGKSQVAVAM